VTSQPTPGPAGLPGKRSARRAQASTPNEIISPNATPPQPQAAIGDVAPGTRAGSVPSVASLTGPRMHRNYVRSRARKIAYGRWQPWAETADPVREHVRRLRRAGASYRTVAQAAGVSPMTVCRLCRDDPPNGRATRVHAVHARRLLAVTPRALRQSSARRDATGARRRLRALTAMGHPAVSLARRLDVPPSAVRAVIGGRAATVTAAMDVAVSELYEQIWDLRPFERTPAERRAAAAARACAARHGWPLPMGQDDERIDDPGYQPRTGWHPGTGVGIPAHVVHRSSSRRGDRRGPL
jgi:hypothetical protein